MTRTWCNRLGAILGTLGMVLTVLALARPAVAAETGGIDISIRDYDSADAQLRGASFTLEYWGEDGNGQDGTATRTYNIEDSEQQSDDPVDIDVEVTASQQPLIQISGLQPGKWKLNPEDAPEGYAMYATDHSPDFSIIANNSTPVVFEYISIDDGEGDDVDVYEGDVDVYEGDVDVYDDEVNIDARDGDDADDVYYENCDDAKAHGVTDIKQGDPGYRPALDRDGDGMACESDGGNGTSGDSTDNTSTDDTDNTGATATDDTDDTSTDDTADTSPDNTDNTAIDDSADNNANTDDTDDTSTDNVTTTDATVDTNNSTTDGANNISTNDVTYENCDDAKAHGVTDIKKGEPGYSEALDGDGDGIACESDGGNGTSGDGTTNTSTNNTGNSSTTASSTVSANASTSKTLAKTGTGITPTLITALICLLCGAGVTIGGRAIR